MEEDDNPQIIGIPDNLCQKSGISVAWRSRNQLGVYPHKHINSYSGDIISNLHPCEPRVHFLRPDVILFSPYLRKLVNESNGVFLSIRKIGASSSDEVKPELVKHSKKYRSILRACVENLQEAAEKATDNDKSILENYLTIFYNVECVWHLTEILYVNTSPVDIVIPQLLEWIRFHFPSRELMASEILAKKMIGAELDNINYWEAVMGCALHGKLDMVQALLSYHSKADHHGFVTAGTMLKTMPVYNVYGGYSVNEFMKRWKHWQSDLASNIEYKTFAIDYKLEELMRLIVGEEEMLWECTKYTEAWYELVAAKLFYSSPCCKQSELARNANYIAEKWKAGRNLDHIILALMENDLHKVIEEIQYMHDNGWFAAHLTDLLFNCEKLNIIDKDQTNVSQLHESIVLDYASTLFEHHSLWQCGASYLENCPVLGLARLEILLSTIPIRNEAKIHKIINIARNNNINNVVTTICKIQGMKCIRRGRLGNALTWAIKAQDGPFATYIADQFLKNYAETGQLECQDLLENLGSFMLTSDRLTFLGKYYEFHQMYMTFDFKEAARLLIALIVSNLTPKYFWSILLSDSIPILESEESLLSSDDTYILLRCVEEHGDDPKFQKNLQIFRFAAVRNLARSINMEGCKAVEIDSVKQQQHLD